jgi:hypothetical protein
MRVDTEKLCQNCTSYSGRFDALTRRHEGVCRNPDSPNFISWTSPDDTCDAFHKPRSRFQHVSARVTGWIIGIVLAIPLWGAWAYGMIYHGDPFWFPIQLVLQAINVALLLIYGCDGPQVPVLCPQ